MEKNVIITIGEQYVRSLEAVADKLRADGLHIKRLYDFGVIIGVIDENNLERISTHKEIEACSEDKNIQLPPPDKDQQ